MADENKTTLTFDEITYLIALLKSNVVDDEKAISFIKDSSFYPSAKARLISERTQSIERYKSIIEKLRSLALEVSKK